MKEKANEVQICYLTQDEINDPARVMQEFTADFSLDAIRKLIVKLREVCSTTENIAFGNAKDREDLFYMTDKVLRFFEASFLQLKKASLSVSFGDAHVRQLTVLEKQIFKNIKNVPNSVPHIPLYGKWLALAGFRPGNLVTIVAAQEKIFITPSKAWEAFAKEIKMRA